MAEEKKETKLPTTIIPHEDFHHFDQETFALSPSALELRDILNAKPGLVWCVVEDEHRFRDNVYYIARTLGRRVVFWTCYQGMVEWQPNEDMRLKQDDELILTPMDAITKTMEFSHEDGVGAPLEQIFSNPEEIVGSVFVLHDMHKFIDDPMVLRALRDLGETIFWLGSGPNMKKGVILTAPSAEIPLELQDITTVVDFKYPTEDEIQVLLDSIKEEGKVTNLQDEVEMEIRRSAKGLSMTRILGSARRCAAKSNYELSPEMIGEEKRQIILQSGIMEIITEDISLDDIGGMDKVKNHFLLMNQALHSAKEAMERNIKTTNDILLVGIPGCGKSYSSKAAAKVMGVDAVRLDMGSIYNSFVGQSEANIRKALKTIEAVAPVVLLVDEVEKGMAGSQSSGQTDGGTSARVFGHFLTWLQEKPDGISVIATANDISQLPPEFLRKGRFDEIYYVGLPTVSEREDIFRIHLRRTAKRNPKDFDVKALAKATDKFTGAEIEALIARANMVSFANGEKLSSEHMLTMAPNWKILAKTEAKKVAKLEQKAVDTWEWCSSDQEKEYASRSGDKKPASKEGTLRGAPESSPPSTGRGRTSRPSKGKGSNSSMADALE